ncbi:uncharacterized protein MYCFIDRAFT_84634 [Pseudocercospora fijiensis CIRAD86]|uniref:RNase H type-1 domain-containing protein n=1 Tax=Pseudocercospora fijiensis (strain CIRAD86) TaxID=383855 RepID=M3A7L4_PSEFD|nr:uncharacterized protein MYCFIDRAFT_84634 [Pseudocercospora fijiensis CIRAD86]EME80606.1 hypothetical protein MYCFIDRAFT_84634 [Pseudocercospora fijiensis CIRAD86]
MASHGTTTATNPLTAPTFGYQAVYTDGSFDPQTNVAGCAFVFKDRATEMWHCFGESCGFQANAKVAELEGIKAALLYAEEHWIGKVTDLEILTDAVKAIGDIEHCFFGGVQRGWPHLAVTIDICNLIADLANNNAASPMLVVIKAVKAHSGIRGNDLADEMAVTSRRTSYHFGRTTTTTVVRDSNVA